MPSDLTFKAQINPLAFIEVEFPSAGEPDSITAENIVSFLCPPGTINDAENFVNRYKTISTGPTLAVAPAEPRILEKLVWPLRHAKASYVVGNNLSVVALCGMVGEMVAILLWTLAEIERNGRASTQQEEQAKLGSTFERLGQEARVRALKKYEIIGPDITNDFNTIRVTRKKYLHLWSHDHGRLPEDAVDCFHAAIRLVIKAIGQDFNDGKLVVDPALVKYLEQKGMWETG